MKQLTTDVAIIAAGPAGLAASIAAAEQGVEVMVFEKSAVPGGTANMGMGPFGVESRLQKANMIGITKEEAFNKMMDYTHWKVDARLVHDYFWKSGDTINWLEDMGVEFAYATKYYPEAEATWHVVQPEGGGRPTMRAASTMTKIMHERAQELGVQFFFETPVKSILKDGDKACGLTAVDKTGEEYTVNAKAVIIATGGFGDNEKMIKENIGYTWGEDLFSIRVPGIVGEGLRMAWEAGAGKGHMEMEQILSHELIMDEKYFFFPTFQQPRTLVVNNFGERIINEEILQNGAVSANVAARQQNKSFYAILTDKIVKYYRNNGVDWPSGVFLMDSTEGLEEAMEEAKEKYPTSVFSADSVHALAQAMGIEPTALEDTVNEYNTSCELHYDDLFCKNRKYLTPIKGKRYYALRFTLGGYGSLGGIKINSRLEVLTDDCKKIKGFYGAGSDVCDIYAGTYLYLLAGNTMGFAVNSGRMAGEYAAEYISDEA